MVNLKDIQLLFPQYYSYFKDANVLVLCQDDGSLPFCFIFTDEDPDLILISYSVDFPLAAVAASIAVEVTLEYPVIIHEEFYIDTRGNTTFGEEAIRQFNLENLDLGKLTVEGKHVH